MLLVALTFRLTLESGFDFRIYIFFSFELYHLYLEVSTFPTSNGNDSLMCFCFFQKKKKKKKMARDHATFS